MTIGSTISTLVEKALSPLFRQLDRVEARLADTERRLERLQLAAGRIEQRQLSAMPGPALRDHECQVFSQWGEDGIIQFLTSRVAVQRKIFIEFGVEDYREANTRFLVQCDNWTGLILDEGRENIDRLRGSEICWRYGLRAVQAFITRDNINQLIAESGISGEIGLLSIDVDGNDYWVWEAIDAVIPDLVVIEYNHRFGSELAVTIPYDDNFRRGQNYPVIYFGASLRALCLLGQRKGYAFVGCNSNGVNAFFVRRDKLPNSLTELSPAEGFVAGKFTETRDEGGFFVPPSPQEEHRLLLTLPLVDVSAAVPSD